MVIGGRARATPPRVLRGRRPTALQRHAAQARSAARQLGRAARECAAEHERAADRHGAALDRSRSPRERRRPCGGSYSSRRRRPPRAAKRRIASRASRFRDDGRPPAPAACRRRAPIVGPRAGVLEKERPRALRPERAVGGGAARARAPRVRSGGSRPPRGAAARWTTLGVQRRSRPSART